VGRHLKEVRIGVDREGSADAISPNLFSRAPLYSYAFVERRIDIPNNNYDFQSLSIYLSYVCFLLAAMPGGGPPICAERKIAGTWSRVVERTHGGLLFGSPPPERLRVTGEVNHPSVCAAHSLLEDNSFTQAEDSPRVTVDGCVASYIAFVSGTGQHAGERAISA